MHNREVVDSNQRQLSVPGAFSSIPTPISTRFKLRDGLAVLDDDDDDDWENVPYPDSAGAGERAVTRTKYADRRALTPTASSKARTPFSDARARGDASPETPGASPETPARDDGFVVVRRPRSHGMFDVLTQ